MVFNPALAALNPDQRKCYEILTGYMEDVRLGHVAAGRLASDFHGPPLTRFVCVPCKHVNEMPGKLTQPSTPCNKCGSTEFAMTSKTNYLYNTVMLPHTD